MLKLLISVCLIAVTYGGVVPQNNEDNHFVVGGEDTDISEVPYQVVLFKEGRFLCGGSVLTPNLIVTAAHCVFSNVGAEYSIRAGSSKISSGGVLVKVKKMHPHPKYDPRLIDYDVAVGELSEPLEFSKNIKPISLIKSEPGNNTIAISSGWGVTEQGGDNPSTLQSVKLPVLDRATCHELLSKYFRITHRMICAGVEGKDTCQGDSGGPLAVDGKLAGIVSFGIGCANKDQPGVYTNVANPEVTSFVEKFLNA